MTPVQKLEHMILEYFDSERKFNSTRAMAETKERTEEGYKGIYKPYTRERT